MKNPTHTITVSANNLANLIYALDQQIIFACGQHIPKYQYKLCKRLSKRLKDKYNATTRISKKYLEAKE